MDDSRGAPVHPPTPTPEILSAIRSGSTLMLWGMVGSILLGVAVFGIMTIWADTALRSLQPLVFATIAAFITLVFASFVWLGMAGWKRILRAEAISPDGSPGPDASRRGLLLVTVYATMALVAYEPVGQFAVAYSVALQLRGTDAPDIVLIGIMIKGLFTLANLAFTATRYFAGLGYLGRLGARLSLPRHPRAARRLLWFSIIAIVLYALWLTSLFAAMILAPINGSLVGIVVFMGVVAALAAIVCMLAALCWYLRLIVYIRRQCAELQRNPPQPPPLPPVFRPAYPGNIDRVESHPGPLATG